MQTFLRLLGFLNLTDDAGNLSITNIGLIALISKMVCTPNIDWPSVVAVITAFANYAHKRAVISNSTSKEQPDAQQ